RERQRFSSRRSSLAAEVEQSLRECSLKTMAETLNRSTATWPFSSPYSSGDDADWKQDNHGSGGFDGSAGKTLLVDNTPREEVVSSSRSSDNNNNNNNNSGATTTAAVCGTVRVGTSNSEHGTAQHSPLTPRSRSSSTKNAPNSLVRDMEGVAHAAELKHSRRARE
ncbi:unnamed protein product, partial [Sphacelaria rigidula]